jgi:hypothetical protein
MNGSASEARKENLSNTAAAPTASRASRSGGSNEPPPPPLRRGQSPPLSTSSVSSSRQPAFPSIAADGEQLRASFDEVSLGARDEARDSGSGMTPSVLDVLRGISDRLEGFSARLDSFERGDRQDRRFDAVGATSVRRADLGGAGRVDAGSDQGGSDGASALGAEYDDGHGADRREGALLSYAREVARAVHWPDWSEAHIVLLRLLEGGAPVPVPGEDMVSTRAVTLRRSVPNALRGLQRVLKDADLRAVALATLFVEPFAVLRDDAAVELLMDDMGVLLAWLYAEHDVSVRCAPDWAALTEREAFVRTSSHVRAPPSQWLRRPADATLDLQVCSAALSTKIPKALVDSQRLLRAIAAGAEDALEVAAGAGEEAPTWELVVALHKIAALAQAGAVSNAEALLAQVTGATASDYKVDHRIKVDKALTVRERAEADAKAALKAQSDATAANEKIAAALVARHAPSPKWGSGAKGAPASSASEASGAQTQSSAPSKRFQKRNAGTSKDGGSATTSANKAVDKIEKSLDASKGDGPA